MAQAPKIPVFFIATRVKREPVVVNFYTKKGEPIEFDAVRKVRTKEGVRFYVKQSGRAKKR